MVGEDSNLRFGVRALQRGLIDERQFIHACTSWADSNHGSLAEWLVAREWLSTQQREDLERAPEQAGAETRPDERPTLTLSPRRGVDSSEPDGLHATIDSRRPFDLIDSILDFDHLEHLNNPDIGTPPLRIRERITLRGLHSSGGIGEVWKAYDEVLEREVALKRLKHDQAGYADNRARFFREAQITGQLDHPGVVPVYDYFNAENGSHCYYTMRFLEGRTLASVITEYHEGRDPNADMVTGPFLQLLGHFISICNTMAFAHSRGVVHRDLKGDNVIVGDFGEVVVLDWGLAKRVGSTDAAAGSQDSASASGSRPSPSVMATMQGERLGTPAFMSPEQAKGEISRIDQRTDVYGLSAILYDILTGCPPFRGEDAVTIMEAVIHQAPVPPRELIPGIPVELERICLCGLAKAPGARWHTVSELGAAIQNWLTNLAERKRTDQERERFFDLSLDLLAIVDRSGHITQSNAAWGSLLGWSEAERQGAALVEFVREDHRESVAAGLAKIWAGQPQAEVEVRMRCADGTTRWFDIRARSIPDEAGAYLVGRDVTDRRQSEKQFIALLESAPDATCVIDRNGTIVLVNRQLERMFGYSREQLLGQQIEVLVPQQLRSRHINHVQRFVDDPAPRPMGMGLELSGQHRNGSTFEVEVSLSGLETETQMLVSCSLRAR
jgi:eukaryotic-like serine/threonine-protein kinase